MITPQKIAIILDESLLAWQKLNVCAFLSSGIAANAPNDLIGDVYRDATGVSYLPIFNQPVLVFECESSKLKTIHNRAINRDVCCAVYVRDMFITNNDVDNRATVSAHASDTLPVVGLGIYGPSKEVDKVTKGIRLHK
jgi:hypothetical protein